MSSPFNYELDEKRIQLELRYAEVPYNEELWHKFEQVLSNSKKTTPLIKNGAKLNLGINQNVIIPIVFIVLIGGVSALLFSFIDFKKKTPENIEIPYETEPIIAESTSSENITKGQTDETIIKQDSVNTADSLNIHIAETPVITTTTNISQHTTETQQASTQSQQDLPMQTQNVKKDVVSTPQKTKKKSKNEVVLPSISAPINLTSETKPEPELDLK